MRLTFQISRFVLAALIGSALTFAVPRHATAGGPTYLVQDAKGIQSLSAFQADLNKQANDGYDLVQITLNGWFVFKHR